MKQIFKILFLLLYISIQAQEYPKIANNLQQTVNVEIQSDFNEITKIHLDLIFNDLISSNEFSKKQVTILRNYEFLRNYRFSNKVYSFETVEKSGIQMAIANLVVFWRMDVSSEKAHYEIFLSHSEGNTKKIAYFFVLEKGNWKLIRK